MVSIIPSNVIEMTSKQARNLRTCVATKPNQGTVSPKNMEHNQGVNMVLAQRIAHEIKVSDPLMGSNKANTLAYFG